MIRFIDLNFFFLVNGFMKQSVVVRFMNWQKSGGEINEEPNREADRLIGQDRRKNGKLYETNYIQKVHRKRTKTVLKIHVNT